jgi:hypothetical protein
MDTMPSFLKISGDFRIYRQEEALWNLPSEVVRTS